MMTERASRRPPHAQQQARLQQLGHEAGPAGLMRGTQAVGIVAIEELMERHVVAEVRITRQRPLPAGTGSRSVGVGQELELPLNRREVESAGYSSP